MIKSQLIAGITRLFRTTLFAGVIVYPDTLAQLQSCFSGFIEGILDRSKKLVALMALLICIFAIPVQADLQPDYYAEPGLNPQHDYLNQNASEFIDPFSGALQRQYIDLLIPGNGGLDIKIQRSYVHPQGTVGSRTVTGVGWDIHFGKLFKSGSACSQTNLQNGSQALDDNPLLVLPDGSQKLLFHYKSLSSSNPLYITKDRWSAECVSNHQMTTSTGVQQTFNTLKVRSPEGTEYFFGYFDLRASANTWYVTKITDRNGNSITINYEDLPNTGYTLIKNITSSDGRSVAFNYTDKTNNKVRLTSIRANSQTWYYNYILVPGVGTDHHFLSSVKRPDNRYWRYLYNSGSVTNGSYALRKVTYPYGATISYAYDRENFPSSTTTPIVSHVIKTKTTGGTNVSPGTWTYSYDQNNSRDRTVITSPNGKYIYTHWGTASTFSGIIWKIGLLKSKESYSNAGTVLTQTETYAWDKQTISQEQYKRSARLNINNIDNDSYAPILTQKMINRNGTNYTTTFSNHDPYGNPKAISESGNGSKQSTVSYYINTSKWIVNQLKNETTTGIGTINRTFNSSGNLTNENRYGVSTGFTYKSTGDIASITNARSKTTNFGTYKRGIPLLETHPQSVSISRSVNNTGTVASENDGRSLTTSYSYDTLNRPTFINLPIHSDTSISWSGSGRSLTRGGYNETRNFDGFGRTISVNRAGIVTASAYNALGQKTFESYPGSSAGTSFQYDILDRMNRITHADNSRKIFTYLSSNRVRVDSPALCCLPRSDWLCWVERISRDLASV